MSTHILLLLIIGASLALKSNPLKEYVFSPDPTYKWEKVSSFTGPGFNADVLKLTSQTWLKPDEVSETVWEHYLVIATPDVVKYDNAFLYVTGSSNPLGNPPTTIDPIALPILMESSVVAILYQVPNQPLVFADDPKGPLKRYEDALIAFTWWDFAHNLDPMILARLPMVKSVVKAMDAVQEYFQKKQSNVEINTFVVAGASKRGWTTWLTPIDERVIGIVPVVIDVLNAVKSINHHWRVYGFFSFALNDYVEMGTIGWLNTEETTEMMNIIDPFEYRDEFTLPKYIVNAAGDEFFLPDSSQFYYDELKGKKNIRYVPNTGHSMGGEAGISAAISVGTWYYALMNDISVPEISWEINKHTGRIVVKTEVLPSKVLMWQAYNPRTRDFRANPNPIPWTSTELRRENDGTYIGRPQIPEEGWRAAFVECHFSIDGREFIQTSAVSVVPDVLPFPPCGFPCECKDDCPPGPPVH